MVIVRSGEIGISCPLQVQVAVPRNWESSPKYFSAARRDIDLARGFSAFGIRPFDQFLSADEIVGIVGQVSHGREAQRRRKGY